MKFKNKNLNRTNEDEYCKTMKFLMEIEVEYYIFETKNQLKIAEKTFF